MSLRTVTNDRLVDGGKLDLITVSQPIDLDDVDTTSKVTTLASDTSTNGVPESEKAKFTVSYDPSTRVCTLTRISDWHYWAGGVIYEVTGNVVFTAHSNTNGDKFFYFDASGNAVTSDSPWNLLTDAPILSLDFTTDRGDGQPDAIVLNEVHGMMDVFTHRNLHFTRGTQLVSGGALSGYTLNSAVVADVQYSVAAARIADEDIVLDSDVVADGGPYIGVYGVSGVLKLSRSLTLPYFVSGGNNIQYNNPATGLVEASSNGFVNYFVAFTTELNSARRCFLIPGQALHSTLALAQAEKPSSLSLAYLTTQELIIRHQVILQRNNGYSTTTGRASIAQVITLIDNTTSLAGAASTSAGAVTFTPAGDVSSTNVQSAIEELDTEKQAVCEEKTTDFTAVVHGNYIITGTSTVTDPTPEAGHGFTCLVRNGTATIGGTAYSIVGTRVERTYHSGAWANAVFYPDAATASSTMTFTNKRITRRVGSTTSSATPTINTDNYDVYRLTAQTADITSFTTNLSGTPADGDLLLISITGTAARAITWGSSFEASTVALPTTTVSTNTLDVGFRWNAATSKWRCVATA
jgi:hypothetical protein